MKIPAIEFKHLAAQSSSNEQACLIQSPSEPPPLQLALNRSESEQRIRLEQFIADKFSSAYGANIIEFLPYLLCHSFYGQLLSVVGLRTGSERTLFLKQYHDSPIEQTIASLSGQDVDRGKLMEIGNLASSYRSGNQLMFVLLTAILARAGYSWVVFTTTAQVRSLLKRLNFNPLTLCEADQSKLVNTNQSWGSYYQSQPLVQAGDIADGLRILEMNSYTAMLLARHESEIASLAEQLRIVRLQCRSAD